MYICEMGLFDLFCPQFCKSDMSRYGYLEVFQTVLGIRDNKSRLHLLKWTHGQTNKLL